MPIISQLVQFSHLVTADSLQHYGLQHARLPCPSPTPRACSNSYASSWWCHPTISSSAVPFSSCFQSFQASGSFLMSWFFASGGQSIGASASASVFPRNIRALELLWPALWRWWPHVMVLKLSHSCCLWHWLPCNWWSQLSSSLKAEPVYLPPWGSYASQILSNWKHPWVALSPAPTLRVSGVAPDSIYFSGTKAVSWGGSVLGIGCWGARRGLLKTPTCCCFHRWAH